MKTTRFICFWMILALMAPLSMADGQEFGSKVSEAEAETGELTGVQVSASGSGYSGTGFVTGFDQEGDQVRIAFDIPAAGTYTIAIRYRNSSGEKTQDVKVNDGYSFPVTFPYRTGFSLADAGDHALHQGQNTITIIKSWGWTDVDQIQVFEARERIFAIDQEPVDSLAGEEARALYDLLKFQFRHRILSGQTHDRYDQVTQMTGKSPLLRVGDFSSYTEGYPYLWQDGGHTLGKDPDGSTEQLIDWWNSTGGKGIVSFQWHWHSPTGGVAGQNNFYTQNTSFDITLAVTPGTPEYDDILRDIDDIAAELKKFQDAGIPVLWRPLHEAGGGWFWWGARGPEPCKALYRILFERLTVFHGLHNLIWVWSTPEEDWYPGNDMVDIIGHDSYPGALNYGTQKYAFDRLFDLTGGQKLVAMTENGPIPDPGACLSEGAPWLFFMSWSDLVFEQNSETHINEVYDHPQVLALESDNFLTGYEWRSSLYPENWQPGYTDSKGRFLHDFSYAGYHAGEVPVPHIQGPVVDVTAAPYLADPTGSLDATGAIQQAINDVGNSGGGVVYLPAGTYRIVLPPGAEHGLVISRDGTVLRGAGPDSTFLFHDGTYLRQKEIIYVAPEYASWFSAGGNSTMIRFDLVRPTRLIPLESVSGFRAGDQVIVLNTPTDSFISEHGMAGLWTAQGIRGVAFKRRVDSVDSEHRLLVLDAPIRYPLKTRDFARVYKAKPHLQECGIESLSIGNRENPKSGWGEEDYGTPGTGAYDTHFSHAILLEYSENCWVRNVHTYRPEVNQQDVHLLSNCLLLNMCRHVTVDSCDFQKPQYEGGGGNGYLYTLQSNDCLIEDCRANDGRHNYDFKYPFSNGNVIHRCRAEHSKYSSDFHMYLSMANLFDECTVNGDYLESMYRPYGGPIHGYSSTQSVFYNTTGEAYHTTRDYLVDSRQYGWGYVIGTSGPAYQVKTDPVTGISNGYSFDTSPRDFVEGVGTGGDLLPRSLYQDQVERRAERETELQNYSVNVLVKDRDTGEPVEGCEVTIYNETLSTDGSGSVLFQVVPEMFLLQVHDPSYLPLNPLQRVIFSDTTMVVLLTAQNYTMTLVFEDESTGESLWGGLVTVDGVVKLTDEEGKVLFTVLAGALPYEFNKVSYGSVEGTLEVFSDTTIVFPIHRTHADVRIWLKEGEVPVNNAMVNLNGDTLVSSDLGLVKFTQRPVGTEYRYTISKTGYVSREGQFILVTDTALSIAMQKISTGWIKMEQNSTVKLWPNPVQDCLNLSVPGDGSLIRISIRDASGRMIQLMEKNGTSAPTVQDRTWKINVSDYPAGIYLVVPSGTVPFSPVPFVKK